MAKYIVPIMKKKLWRRLLQQRQKHCNESQYVTLAHTPTLDRTQKCWISREKKWFSITLDHPMELCNNEIAFEKIFFGFDETIECIRTCNPKWMQMSLNVYALMEFRDNRNQVYVDNMLTIRCLWLQWLSINEIKIRTIFSRSLFMWWIFCCGGDLLAK